MNPPTSTPITFPTPSLATFMCLERIDCPMLKEGKPDVGIRDMAAAGFILSRPPEETLGLLDQGRATFDAAVTKWAGGIQMAQLRAMVADISSVVQGAFSFAPSSVPSSSQAPGE